MKRARLLQWLVFFFFFRQTRDLIVYVPRFSTDFTRFTVNPAVTGLSPCFSQKLFRAFVKADETEGPLFQFFFGTLRLFCLRSVLPSSFLNILQQTKVPKITVNIQTIKIGALFSGWKVLLFLLSHARKAPQKIFVVNFWLLILYSKGSHSTSLNNISIPQWWNYEIFILISFKYSPGGFPCRSFHKKRKYTLKGWCVWKNGELHSTCLSVLWED